jgi:putative oxidoreductase
MGWFGGQAVPLLSWPQGAAGIIETVGGFLIMIGLLTRPAASSRSGEMAVAFFMIHVGVIAPGKQLGFPLISSRTCRVASTPSRSAFAFLYICSRGAGLWSVDGAMGKK